MSMKSLIESLGYQIGRNKHERFSMRPWLSPQSVFVDLERITEHQAPLYADLASHAAAIRNHYPVYVEQLFKGTPENTSDTENLFDFHEVEFNDDNYAVAVASVLAEINNLTDDELSVLRF